MTTDKAEHRALKPTEGDLALAACGPLPITSLLLGSRLATQLCSWSDPHKGLRVPDYGDAWLDRDKLRKALRPEDTARVPWLVVRTISEHPEDRDGALCA
jgi:hypothetical protein